MTAPTVYMTASRALKMTAPRARPWLRFRKTGYSEMAMPALAPAATSSSSPPADTWPVFPAILVR